MLHRNCAMNDSFGLLFQRLSQSGKAVEFMVTGTCGRGFLWNSKLRSKEITGKQSIQKLTFKGSPLASRVHHLKASQTTETAQLLGDHTFKT